MLTPEKVLAILNAFETSTVAQNMPDLARLPHFMWINYTFYVHPVTNLAFVAYLEGCLTGEIVGEQRGTPPAGYRPLDLN